MIHEKSLSLKSYLVKSQVLLSVGLLLLCISGLFTISLHTFKSYTEQNLQLITQSLSEQLQAPLVFNEQKDIEDVINNFMRRYELSEIQLEDMNGNIIYQVNDPKQSNTTNLMQKIQHSLISNDAGQFYVTHNQMQIGKLAIRSNINPVVNFMNLLLLIFIACLLLSLFIVWLSTRFIYKKINNSLDVVTHTTGIIAEKKAFQLRVPMTEVSEFNTISERFNFLLNEIQSWESDLQTANSNLEHRILHDNLTLLPNRSYFQQQIQQLFNDPNQKSKFALLFIDNDNFKAINDNYGHQVGDAVLVEMSERLKKSLRSGDFIARLGGDEFAVLLPNTHKPEHAIAVANHLIQSSELPMVLSDQTEVTFSFSIGIALSHSVNNVDQLIHTADLAMYQAKINKHRKWAMFEY